jgi:uncharacterized protein
MSPAVPRLVPEEPLPAYAFVPGRFPHPISDPKGHRFGAGLTATRVDPEHWQECRLYLLGFDLFNHGYYWESHVAWESLWLGCGRKGMTADFLKGLIKLAAAGVKACEGRPEGVMSHCRRVVNLWLGVWRSLGSESRTFMGLGVADLIALAKAIEAEGWPEPPPLLVPEVIRD